MDITCKISVILSAEKVDNYQKLNIYTSNTFSILFLLHIEKLLISTGDLEYLTFN